MTGVTVQNVINFRVACHYVISFLFLVVFAQNGSHAARYARRYCPTSEIEVLSERGVKIEPVHKSRVEISLTSWFGLHRNTRKNRRFQLQLSFKTTSPNGVLFYGMSPYHPNELIAITLQDGQLFYTIRCPTLHADLFVPTKERRRVDDGMWHNISYSVRYSLPRHNKIEIDGYSNSKRYEVTCAPVKSIVLGGLSPTLGGYTWEFEGLRGHFEGCIRNLRIPTPFRKPPKYYAVSVCD